jgi:hypothetical protein
MSVVLARKQRAYIGVRVVPRAIGIGITIRILIWSICAIIASFIAILLDSYLHQHYLSRDRLGEAYQAVFALARHPEILSVRVVEAPVGSSVAARRSRRVFGHIV